MEKEFIELIDRYQGVLQKICNLYFYGNPYREDYYQEMLLRLWHAFPSFKKRCRPSTWIYRVALNVAIDQMRQQTARPAYLPLSDKAYDIPSTPPVLPDGKETRKEMLYHAIGKLNEMERAIIFLYLEEYEYKEIAEIVGISETNVGVKINRIKNKLTQLLKHEK